MHKSETWRFVAGFFLRFLIPYWFQGFIVLLCVLCITAGSLAPPYITKIIIDDILPNKQFYPLLIALAVMLSIIGTSLNPVFRFRLLICLGEQSHCSEYTG